MATTKLHYIGEVAKAAAFHGLLTYVGTNQGNVYQIVNSTGVMTKLTHVDGAIIGMSINHPTLYFTTNNGNIWTYDISTVADPVTAQTFGASSPLNATSWTQETAMFAVGTYAVPVVVATPGATVIPIQVNLSSTGNMPIAGSQVAAARLRVDSDTNHQANTALSCLQLRMDLATNVYAATNISASINVSADIALPTATMQGIFCQITGAGIITCPNNVNVLECRVFQTAPGAGVDNVAEFAMNSSGCAITNILELINYAGTVTNGLLITGAFTNGINLTNSAISATGGRLAKFVGVSATPAMEDGYGVFEIDTTITGTGTGNFAATSAWVNIPSGATCAVGGYICARTDGIYEDVGATVTNSILIFGAKMTAVIGDTNYAVLAPFCLNSTQNISALFVIGSPDAKAGIVIAGGGCSTAVGSARLFQDSNGTKYYVKLYSDPAS